MAKLGIPIMSPRPQITIRHFFIALIVVGTLMRAWGLNDAWKRNDHYNFGGIWTTAYAECWRETPLAVDRGVVAIGCESGQPAYYRSHPPTVPWALAHFTSWIASPQASYGYPEWSYRLFTLIFSCLNIIGVFLVARAAKLDSTTSLMAAALQSIALGNMYFGTHLDFISEFTLSFCLLSGWLALKAQKSWHWGLSSLTGVIAGLTAWPGTLVFAPLTILAWWRSRRHAWLPVLGGTMSVSVAVLWMGWLQRPHHEPLPNSLIEFITSSADRVIQFLEWKLINPGYVKETESLWLKPIKILHNFFMSQSRLLGPLIASFGLLELFRASCRRETQSLQIALAAGGTGAVYALMGQEYHRVHVFLYLLLTPALVALAAIRLQRLISTTEPTSLRSRRLEAVFLFILAAVYPFGIYKSSPILDALASIALVGATLAAIYFTLKTTISPAKPWLWPALVGLTALGNVFQLLNYRAEPSRDREVCAQALIEAEATGTAIPAEILQASDARRLLYCVRRHPKVDSPSSSP